MVDANHTIRESSSMSILPEDPLVRWLIWFVVAVSVGAPLLAALVMAMTS